MTPLAQRPSRARLPCAVSSARREQHREEGFVLNNDIIDRLERDQEWPSAGTGSGHLCIMAPSHPPFLWLPHFCLTRFPKISREQTLPRAGYSTLSVEAELDLGD